MLLYYCRLDIPEVPDVLRHRNTKCSTVREVRTGIPKKSGKPARHIVRCRRI